MTLGKRIKAARERLKPEMTQSQLGAFFKITDKAVSSWERGKTIPEPKKLAELARRLQVPCIWLLDGAGPPPPPDSLEVEIESLRPSERAVVRATMEALRKQRDSAA